MPFVPPVTTIDLFFKFIIFSIFADLNYLIIEYATLIYIDKFILEDTH
jgi:hypothetical protein